MNSAFEIKFRDYVLLPMIGVIGFMVLWCLLCGVTDNLPNPLKMWNKSELYIYEPFAKRGEMDQGILRFTMLSISLVGQGYLVAILFGTPLGFILGLSKFSTKAFDPIIQILRPVSPLAWYPLGLVLFERSFEPSYFASLFTISVCAMWPTVLNTAVGVRAIPQDYINVAKVLKLSKSKTLFKVLIPATLPYMFTGFRLSLGIAWLVIVAVEMLKGQPGIGGFLWDAYNAGNYALVILCILVIGLVGFCLDRIMSVVEGKFRSV